MFDFLDLSGFLKRGGRSNRRNSRARRNAIGHHRGLYVEPLEDRSLLSVVPLNVVADQQCGLASTTGPRVPPPPARSRSSITARPMTTAGLDNLLASVSATHGGDPIGHLAIMAHGGPGEIDLGNATI